MPRESTRRIPRFSLLEGGSDVEVQERGRDLRVTLSGELDRERLARLRRRIAPRLVRRGRRIVLDGSELRHVDYRAVGLLLAWHRELHEFGHDLLISRWNDYLRTILVLGAAPQQPDTAASASGRRVAS